MKDYMDRFKNKKLELIDMTDFKYQGIASDETDMKYIVIDNGEKEAIFSLDKDSMFELHEDLKITLGID